VKSAEPSAERGWLSSSVIQFKDRDYPRRLTIAFAAAIALHEIAAGLVPRRAQSPPPERIIAQVVTVQKRPPTPKPTPRPTPRPPTPAPRYTRAPHPVLPVPAALAAATPRPRLGGAAAHRRIVHPVHHPTASPAPPRSLANASHAGTQNGGAGSGAGPGTGEGGQNGTGSGSGTAGNGNGADAATAPCGFVTFYGKLDHVGPDGEQYVHVRLVVTLRDGATLSDELHWLFVYKDEASNPFTPAHPDAEVLMQFPPPGTDPSAQSSATLFALQHTDPAGYTNLPECPATSAP
jgi:hypothetical protein